MQTESRSTSIDWIVLTFRWLFLVGVTLWLAVGIGFTWPVILLLSLTALWNAAATVLVVTSRNTSLFRIWSAAGDMAFAYLLFFMTGMLGEGIAWGGLLPVVTAALYHQWIGALLATFLNILGQGLLAWDAGSEHSVMLLLGILLFLYLVVGLPVAYASRRFGGRAGIITWSVPLGEAGEEERKRRRVMYDLISALSSSLNYQRVLGTALDYGMNALSELKVPAERLIGVVLLFAPGENKKTELQVAASRRLIPSDNRVTLPGTSGLIAHTIEEGKACMSKDVRNDPELSRFIALHKCRSAYCYPLRTGIDVYGILIFAHPDLEFFSSDRREVLDIIGNQSGIALQNARLYKDLEQEKERMMEIQDESRKKLARDLHDGPTQSVAAIAMRVNFARRLMDRDSKAASEELFKIEDLARRTTKEIRHMLFTLRPLVLESQGLVAALESMAEKMKETYSQNVIIQADPRVVEALEPGKQAVAFYIAEEAVTNARKHAKAGRVWVRIKILKENLSLLEIEDDGVGFEVNTVDSAYESRGSLGMVNMRERTELVNGVLRIDSAIGRGTRVQVIIPLTEDAAERIRRGA